MIAKDLGYLAKKLGHQVIMEETPTKAGYQRNYIRQIDNEQFTKSSADQARANALLREIVWGGKL